MYEVKGEGLNIRGQGNSGTGHRIDSGSLPDRVHLPSFPTSETHGLVAPPCVVVGVNFRGNNAYLFTMLHRLAAILGHRIDRGSLPDGVHLPSFPTLKANELVAPCVVPGLSF
jgi:hypothetical protein